VEEMNTAAAAAVPAGLAVTSATVVIFGSAVRDPVQLLSHFHQPAAVCVALFGELNLWHLSFCLLSTNSLHNQYN
jgi:cytosine/uracil/thiamine/allantoin permease